MPVAMKRQTSLSLRVTKTLATDGCAVLRIREDASVVQKRFGFPENSGISLPRWSRTVHGARRHRQSGDAATAHGRGGRHARCCARGPKAKTETHSSSDKTQHHLTQQQTTLHSKWRELAQEDRSISVSRDARITPNSEQDQGPFALTLRRRRQRRCEWRTGPAIIVMTARGFDRIRAADW